jgi:hypothetical protein
MRKNICRSGQGYELISTWIRIILGSWNRVSIKVKIQELQRLKTELWRAVDAHSGTLRLSIGAVEGSPL